MSATEQQIRDGTLRGPIRLRDRLNLTHFQGRKLPDGLHCYDLDASGSCLEQLPADLKVDNRLILDDCPHLRSLPQGLQVGSLSLRNCPSLEALPEDLECWFLDLTNCTAFAHWPRRAQLHHGSLVLRNCISLRNLPRWLGRLSTLDLSGCVQIQEVPENLEINRWIDLGGSGLTHLHQDFPLRWRGVPIDRRIAFRPQEITAREALQEPNAERRRVLIERMGYLRFAREANPEVIHEDRDPGGPRRLLKIELDEDEPLVGLSCCCPSTGRQYLIRVPPTVKSCHEAAAWIAGFDDPSLYRPEQET